jgi:hypothetical protein
MISLKQANNDFRIKIVPSFDFLLLEEVVPLPVPPSPMKV